MSEERKPEPIAEIEKRYPNECLAIIVTKTDKYGDPIEGILLYHTPNRKELFEKIRGHPEHILITYTFEWPEGMEVILNGDVSV